MLAGYYIHTLYIHTYIQSLSPGQFVKKRRANKINFNTVIVLTGNMHSVGEFLLSVIVLIIINSPARSVCNYVPIKEFHKTTAENYNSCTVIDYITADIYYTG